MARIAVKARDEILHLRRRPLDPLEEDAAAENEYPGNLAGYIAALRKLDEAADLDVVDTYGGTTAVYESVKNGGCVVRV